MKDQYTGSTLPNILITLLCLAVCLTGAIIAKEQFIQAILLTWGIIFGSTLLILTSFPIGGEK